VRTTRRSLHDGWTFRQIDASPIPNSDLAAWQPAEVPGHVHLDLLRLGVIPDPFERMHERSVQWVDDADWAYRCAFAVDANELTDDGSRHVLRFEGLDTIATILLNDEVVATTDNMFVEHEFDVTDRLKAGTNDLEVHFRSAERVGAERLAASPDLEAFQVQAGRRHGLLPRSMVRKAQYHWGWDWGPRLRGCGIWRDVQLVRVPKARITDWSWRVRFGDDGGDPGSASVTVDVATDGDVDDVEVRLRGHGTDVTASGTGPVVLRIDDPERWWCAGLGDQPLYDLTVVARASGTVVDDVEARIGLREIELVREPDEAGESFVFHVNGVPIFAKGANWIPDDSFPARTTRERLFDQLRLARDCGMNMLRIWGGGLYETKDFYDACDELGLLVWQDFPYACAMYPEDDATVAAATKEATAAVRRLRNHTSLALWCGNNENQWLAHMGFFGRIPKVLGERLYDDALPAVVAAEDPDRPYWPSSPWGSEADPSGDGTGDCHYWNVWHGEGDWTFYTKCTSRFVSEFGFSGPPDRRTLEVVLRAEELGVDTPAMRWHDKTSKGYETYLGYIALHYPMPETYDDLVYYGQLNQADAMRFGIEHFRRLRPHTMGTLAWQLNDCWPVQSWAWIDHALRPKAVWYAAKRFYAPLLLSLWSTHGEHTVRASLVNDAVDRGRTGTLELRAFGADGSVVWSERVDASVEAAASAVVHECEPPDDAVLLHATFDDVESTLLLVEPKDLVLPAADLKVEVTDAPDGASTIHLEAATPALSVLLWLDGADATWSDNAFHVLPGRPRTIEVRPAERTTSVADRLRWRAMP
jgi:beta-mannosidase